MMRLLDPLAKLVVGHRGESAFAPENTLEALGRAVALGADAIEFDLRLTREGVAVVHHDATVDRTTDGSGPVAAKSLAELRELDAGARFPGGAFRGKGIGVPTFEEVLAAFPETPCIIELKIAPVAQEARRLIERHGAQGRVLVDSFVGGALEPFRGSGIAVGGSAQGAYRMLRSLVTGPPRAGTLDFRALCIPWRHHGLPVPVAAIARQGHNAGIVTHVWTVDDPVRAERFWRGGVNGIITNDPGRMLEVRRRVSG